MLSKLETKSNRVKGLSFHPTRPWILVSLHNGVIQLWDYRIKTIIERFDEHDGPVRGVCFHPTQPLFVSGGDDYKIKVWNYKQRRCLFTLLGHLDYIRTVEFHREYPWILSSSDDQTIRIWNWQSRTCISILTGHNHYVMCASFHPKDDLIVSASLDQTVRVWDISGLRKKSISPNSGIMGIGGIHSPSSDDNLRISQNDLFGNTDVIVKYVLEGHDRGVNWASFHPSSPLIVSGADDRQVKLWRMSDTKAWEVDTFRGHFNNVSCVLFHPKQDLILSNSEDKTIRVWDISKRQGIQTFRREHDRFWILAAHPESNLFAAGHDSGMIIFKLERERPAFTTYQNELVIYIKDKYFRTCEFSSARDIPILSLRNKPNTGKIKNIHYNSQDRAILMCTEQDGNYYELFQLSEGKNSIGDSGVEGKRGVGLSAVFVGRQRFAVLDKSHQIIIKNLKNEETKRFMPPTSCGNVDSLFPAPIGFLLLRSDDKITLYDVQQRKALSELAISDIKFIYWSYDKSSNVALVGKDKIVIANKKLEQLCSIHETIRIKSGTWDENGIFIYSTLNHIKYCLPNGDNGIVRTLDSPLYITGIKGNKVFCLDRECKNRIISVDPTEYLFKFALIERKYSQVLKMVKESNLIGQSIISYLQKKGFPEVALYFVKDEKTRFSLALECGNIEVALESAKVLDNKDDWLKLAVEALKQGNHQIVEMAFQRTKNFEKLSFLYLITGNIDKLKKMLKISEMRNDINSRFHNSLYLGDIGERIKILEQVGQIPLAYVMAKTYGLQEETTILESKLIENKLTIPNILENAELLIPPIPILRLHENNWPLLNIAKGYFEGPPEEEKKFGIELNETELNVETGEWDSMNLPEEVENNNEVNENLASTTTIETGPSEWDVDLDLEEIKDIDINLSTNKVSENMFVVLPHSGPTISQIWCENSSLVADHVAAGSFESAMKLLNQQIGVVNFKPLKPFFLKLFISSRVSMPIPHSSASFLLGLNRNVLEISSPRQALPLLSISLPNLLENYLKIAYKATTAGKFSEALQNFIYILHSIPFLVVDSKKEANEIKELIGVCREYLIGIRMELQRKELQASNTDAVRQTELACYFTHCNLQQIHLMLCLRSAMNCSYKIKNFKTASSFAKRLLELDPQNEVSTQARKVVKHAEQNPNDAYKLNYNERNPFVICGISFTPIYKGSLFISCPYCSTSFLPEHKGKLCPTCQLSEIGKEVSGLQLYNVHSTINKEKNHKPSVLQEDNDW